MTMSLRIAGLLLIGAVCAAAAPHAVAMSFDDYCDRAGFSAPLRQTLVVIDERAITPEPGGQPAIANKPWRRFLDNLLPGNDSTLSQSFEPRERVAIVIARRDGAGMKEVLTGCLPFYSEAEKKQIVAKGGYMGSVQTFLGTSPIDEARKALETFRVRLGQSIRDALQPAALSTGGASQNGTLASSGLVASLRQGGSFVNLALGLPRIIFYSDMTRYFHDIPASVAEARKAGEQAGEDAGIDLKGAEVYVVGVSPNARSRDLLSLFFLTVHGELQSVGSADMVPRFASAPRSVTRYQGLIHYPDNQFSIRIRIATDTSGSLQSSWLSVQASREQFSPVHGVLTCGAEGSCVYSGDQVFAQVWNPEHGSAKEPTFNPSMPFGGVRYLSLKVEDNRLTGKIYDPIVHYIGVAKEGPDGKPVGLQFEAARQPKALF